MDKIKKHSIRFFLTILIILVSAIIVVGINEYYNIKKIENTISKFHAEYKEFINQDLLIEDISDISTKVLFRSSDLQKYYDKIRIDTLSSIKEINFQNEQSFNLLKNENTSYFSKELLEEFNILTKANKELFTKSQTENLSEEEIEIIINNNNRLLEIIQANFDNNTDIINGYNNAKDNIDTLIETSNTCFLDQVENDWILNATISSLFCNTLGKCNNNKVFKDEANSPVSITLNNPKNRFVKSYEYVSYFEDDFKIEYILNNMILKDNETYFIEVFEKEIAQRSIYKYNIVVIDSDSNVDCSGIVIPKQ